MNDDFYTQAANRYDFRVNCLVLLVLAAAWIYKANAGEPIWFARWGSIAGGAYNDWTRIALCLPLLRAFSTIRLIRDIVMGMLTVLPSYFHVVTLLLIVFYFYAALGCMLFASTYKYIDYELRDANFNSFLDACVTLFQLFVGEAWNTVLEAALNTGRVGAALCYFISFIVLITLLFTNLIIGIICSGYETISEVAAEMKADGGGKVSSVELVQALKEGRLTERKLSLSYSAEGAIRIARGAEEEEEEEEAVASTGNGVGGD